MFMGYILYSLIFRFHVADKRLQVSVEGDLDTVKEKLNSGTSTPGCYIYLVVSSNI